VNEADLLHLRLYPDPVLRVRCRPVDQIDAALRAHAHRMLELMHQHNGIGLAGPQAGLDLRLFVCDVPEDEEPPAAGPGPATGGLGPLICINPVIADPSPERSAFDEGCLSLPGLRGDVVRPEAVTLHASDLDGRPFQIRAAGLLARCVQHELDHLDGVLIIDRMTHMSRMKNRRRLREMEQG
jgi:peptide deformylase